MNPLLSRTFKHQRRLRNNLFSWYVDERGCELRRLLYSKREKPVSSKNKNIFRQLPCQRCGKHCAQRCASARRLKK
jgi:hypothetical protein